MCALCVTFCVPLECAEAVVSGFRKNVCWKILRALDVQCTCMTSNLKECLSSDCVLVIDFDISQTLAFSFDSRICWFFFFVRMAFLRFIIYQMDMVSRARTFEDMEHTKVSFEIVQHRSDIRFCCGCLAAFFLFRLSLVWDLYGRKYFLNSRCLSQETIIQLSLLYWHKPNQIW